jgi:hypothetical protein
MPLDDGQAITDIFETVYDGQLFFHLGQLRFGPFLQAAIKRATLDNVRYTEKGCGLLPEKWSRCYESL